MKRAEQNKSMPIVADGQERAISGASLELAARRARVMAAIEEKYVPRLQQVGMIRRLWLRLQMSLEIRRQMWREKEKIAPSGALYAATWNKNKDSRPL